MGAVRIRYPRKMEKQLQKIGNSGVGHGTKEESEQKEVYDSYAN